MSRLDAKWLDFTQRGQVWDHFWQDGPSPVTTQAFSQAQVAIKTNLTQYAQSICYIKVVGVSSVAQSQVDIRATSQGYAQAQSAIKITSNDFAQAQSLIKVQVNTFAQAQAHININVSVFAQAQTYINVPDVVGAFQSDAFQNDAFQVSSDNNSSYAQAQAQAEIKQTYQGFAQAQTYIKVTNNEGFAQAQARITGRPYQFAQAQPYIFSPSLGRVTQGRVIAVGAGDSQGRITQGRVIVLGTGISSARITQGRLIALVPYASTLPKFAQAAARITSGTIVVAAQAQAYIKIKVGAFSQAEVYILTAPTIETNRWAQARVKIEECLDTVFYDSYTRTGSGTLGTPDIGPDYDESFPEDYASISIDGSIATVSGSLDYDYGYTRVPITTTDFIASVDFKPGLSAFASYADLMVRNLGDFTRAELWVFDNGSESIVRVYTYSNSEINDPITLDDTKWYTAKLSVSGGFVKAKVWKRDVDPEPDWQYEFAQNGGAPADSAEFDYYTDIGEDLVDQQFDNLTLQIPCDISTKAFAQAQAYIKATVRAYAQSQAYILNGHKHAQAQATIKATSRAFAQARCSIKATTSRHAQAQVLADRGLRYSQANADIVRSDQWGWGQAKTTIALKSSKPAQAQTRIRDTGYKYGLAQAQIRGFNDEAFAQANALISSTHKQAYGQAQCKVQVSIAFAQAQCLIKQRFGFSQSQVMVEINRIRLAQSLATIKSSSQRYAQASALILGRYRVSQAQARIKKTGAQSYAQAQARLIRTIAFGNAQCFIEGGKYLVRYNQYLLPGYAQTEAFTNSMRMDEHSAPYIDASLTEYVGLENKLISLSMKVAESTYLDSKNQVQLAGTMLRSSNSWAKLYIQRSDRHYLAMTKTIKIEQEARSRDLDYSVEFEAQPWLISDATYTASGIGLITITRTLDDGGWTPATIQLTGTNITVSGYTATEPATGFISVSGAVTNLVVTTQPYTATIGGVNSLPYIRNSDYELYIGPGTTYVTISGASAAIITYNNRWYL